MDMQTLIPLLLKLSILLTVFSFGLQTSWADAIYLFRRPSLLIRSLLAMYLVMPIVAVAIVLAFDLHPAIEIAIIALSVSPIPPILPKKHLKTGGNEAYVAGMLVAPAILAIAFIPLALAVLQSVFHVPITTTAAAIAKIVATTVLAPLAAGMIVRRLLGAWGPRVAKVISIIATIMLLCGVLPVLVVMWPALRALLGNGTLVALAVFALVGLAVGHVFGSEERGHRSVLAISTATRHPGIAMSIAHANFPNVQETAPAVLLYVLVAAIVTAPYVARRKKAKAKAKAASSPVVT